MNVCLKIFSFQLLILMGLPLCAQQLPGDTALHLIEVTVKSSRLQNFSAGIKIQKIDSATMEQYRSGTLSDILENETPVFVKSYGLGSLATTSFRGSSAEQTDILWDGFNLNSPMNGVIDLSLIPNSFIDNVTIQYGGASALWGSGAVGGTILLGNDELFNQGLSISFGSSFESFSQYRQNIGFVISKSKWVSSIKVFNVSAKNNFEYYNTQIEGSPEQQQTNAALQQYGLLFENKFQTNNGQQLKIGFWYQNSNRDIPPSMVQTISDATQQDWSYRLTSEWQKVNQKVTYIVRAAYFNENLLYVDSLSDLRSLSRSQTVIAEAEAKIKLFKNQLVNIGANNTFAQAESDGYANNPQQNRFALFGSYTFRSENDKFHSTISVRQEFIGGIPVPFTYSLGSDYILFKWLSAKGNISKVYRIPTFNDLYWNPGGNPNLLPENGFSEEAGLLVQLHSVDSRVFFSTEATVYNRNINNWILWLPGELYWSPENILKVWSRGMETRSELEFKLNKIRLKIGIITNYVLSTNQQATSEDDESVDKQLIYVPMYSANGKISVGYKGFTIAFNQNYTGYRFTSTDNTEYLLPYTISNLYASYNFRFSKYSLNLFLQDNNIFSKQYQIIQNQAMPLVNYMAGISVQFNNPNNNNQNK